MSDALPDGGAGSAAATVAGRGARFVAAALPSLIDPLLRMPLRLSDRPLVAVGQPVEPGQPIVERFREQEIIELPTTAPLRAHRPGAPVDRALVAAGGKRGRQHERATYRARVIEHGRDGTTRLAAGLGDMGVLSPVTGRVEALSPGRLDVRAEGLGIAGQVAWGRPASGRVLIAARGPDSETRSSAIDVGFAGAVLVVGARLDIEALTRARAIGVAAVICGGLVSRDIRQLEEAEGRQRAALHAAAPFGLLAIGGYGRSPIPRQVWDMLVAAEGRPAGTFSEDRLLVIGGDPAPLLEAAGRSPGTVRVASGELAGQEGRLVGLSGPRRWRGGLYAPGGFVELPSATGRLERVCLPLSELERLG